MIDGTFSIKQNDLQPNVRAQLVFTDSTAPNLTGVPLVTFRMRSRTSGALKIDAPAVVIDPTAAIVEYAWVAGDTDAIDSYDSEWIVSWPDGDKQTFPSNGFGRIDVTERI
jgi:hypothetical protein